MTLAFDLSGGPEAAAAVLSQATSGSVQQVTDLVSLSSSTLDLAATLLTVSVVEIESSSGTSATGPSAGQGRGSGRANDSSSHSGDEAEPDDLESQAAIEKAPPWERLAIDWKRSWERAAPRFWSSTADGRWRRRRNATAPPAEGRQTEPPIPAPARPPTPNRTGAQAQPAPPSQAATVAPFAPVAASSIRRQRHRPGRRCRAGGPGRGS